MEAGSARTGKEPQESDGFGPPSAPDLKAEHYQVATAGALQFRVSVTPFPLRRSADGCGRAGVSPWPRLSGPSERGHERGVNG